MENKELLKSGEFLVRDISPEDIFIPEEFDEEQLMIAQTCKDFLEAEVYPHMEQLEKGDRELMKTILKKSGELGLMGVAVNEEYGGFGQSFVTQMLTAETIGAAYSFSVAFMAHCGIGTLPIMYFGNEDQRERYVTKLATGEFLGAYCLTEPGAGSDANAGKSNAVPSEDGSHYILNGQKMWITNAGFADTQTVFAKIENDRVLSAFIVDTASEGVVIGPDEHKMGIKGSSTAQIYYNDVKVPSSNLLGKRGEGFRIALSILHMGRIKLGANVIGAAKRAINNSVQYANERKQFGMHIASFGAIKHKLAEMVIRTFAAESATYRVSNDIDRLIDQYMADGTEKGRASIDAIAHYAVEAAVLKVYGSEMLDIVADEAVQIHGGMGYSSEMEVERGYRDSRINRIFEGTNEINRILVVDTAMKRAMKGQYGLFEEAEKLAADISAIKAYTTGGKDDFFTGKSGYVKNMKKIALLLLNFASETFGRKLVHEQEILNNISDIIMEIYVAESLALRVAKIEKIRGDAAVYRDIADVYTYDIIHKVRKWAMDAIYSMDNENTEDLLKAVDGLSVTAGVNVKEARRRIADKLIEDNTYKF
ncbi:MAG: acyl-CoA dehydrogenase family protein [Bacteroidales bacterium]|jgi:alkylation response protein AidB-like acyl-CoA dehydrogenase|nr:acyl-CoA dehydrogenase family protein [Bacteroidales bacterium]